MKFKDINKIEKATKNGRDELFRVGMAVLFIVGIMIFLEANPPSSGSSTLLIAAAMIGGYMALNIGANDVANNVGPAVGSQALTLVGAIIIAAIFESAGALIAGGDVVSTIKKGIIDPAQIVDIDTFIWLMMAALLAGAIWLNVATIMGAPVSTTHSIVGGVLGAGIAAGGMGIANWPQMGKIVASWIISPLLGAIIAAFFLYLIKRTITYKTNPIESAKKIVPILLMVMTWTFSTYIILKGLKKLWPMEFLPAAGIGAIISIILFFIIKPLIASVARKLPNDKNSVNNLFTIPLIFAAALLSFAHGANDVANAVGPLAAINEAISGGVIAAKTHIPLWVMMVGAIGISLGLALYGPKLIKTVGTEITELNKVRAFSIAMAASITVIIASQLGLPVSSTHIAVGGIFGVGFLREYLKNSYGETLEEIKHHHDNNNPEAVEKFLNEFKRATLERQNELLKKLKEKSTKAHLTKKERRALGKIYRQKLVKRSHLLKIAAAWLITVPVSALLAALIFYMIRGMMLP
ncbi:MAG: inorganic phosphate transporter [Alcanivoracaceae bacterium]|nr:inorganic phosphate transporter [Alcanivoracaceae bacterium]